MACEAAQYLTEDDWTIVQFWVFVKDQLVDLTPPLAEPGSLRSLAPRLEAWEAACRLLGVPRRDRIDLIEATRYLGSICLDQVRAPLPVFTAAPADLAPLW